MTDLEKLVIEWRDAREEILPTDWSNSTAIVGCEARCERLVCATDALMAHARAMERPIQLPADPDQALINACSNVAYTVDEIAKMVGRPWPAVLGDLNRLHREGRVDRTRRWRKAALWRSYGKPAP